MQYQFHCESEDDTVEAYFYDRVVRALTPQDQL